MSVRVMTAVWDIPMEPMEKLVLLAMADCANDEGICWPSIATIARKSGTSERTVQRSIQSMKERRLIEREEVIGKGCRYRLTPDTVTPQTDSHPRHTVAKPVTDSHPTPDTVTPKPSRNHQEPSEDGEDGFTSTHVFEFWNEKAETWGKRKVRDRTPERKKLVEARIGQHGIDGWREVIANFNRSDFLQRAQGCHFDWLIQKKNFLKVLEGNYNG